MTAYDPTSGELRTHYAGFFDPGFGYDPDGRFLGSRAALEVRAHDVPFMIEHGQRVCKPHVRAHDRTARRALRRRHRLRVPGPGRHLEQALHAARTHCRRALTFPLTTDPRYPPSVTETPRLPEGELLFRRIVEDSPAAVVLLTDEAVPRVLYASPRIEEIAGYRPDELVEQPDLWIRRIHPDESAATWARRVAAIESGARFEADYRFRHRSGEWRWFRETSTPVPQTDGAVAYRQSFVEDISSERFAPAQAERSETRYRSLVERLPVLVYVDTDEERPRSLYVSPNSRAMLGYDPADYLADSNLWFASMHPSDLDRVQDLWARSIATRAAVPCRVPRHQARRHRRVGP